MTLLNQNTLNTLNSVQRNFLFVHFSNFLYTVLRPPEGVWTLFENPINRYIKNFMKLSQKKKNTQTGHFQVGQHLCRKLFWEVFKASWKERCCGYLSNSHFMKVRREEEKNIRDRQAITCKPAPRWPSSESKGNSTVVRGTQMRHVPILTGTPCTLSPKQLWADTRVKWVTRHWCVDLQPSSKAICPHTSHQP